MLIACQSITLESTSIPLILPNGVMASKVTIRKIHVVLLKKLKNGRVQVFQLCAKISFREFIKES